MGAPWTFWRDQNAVIEPENSERVKMAGVNGPVFMGPDQRCERDECDPQE